MSSLRKALPALVVIAVTGRPESARAVEPTVPSGAAVAPSLTDEAELARATSLYESGKYVECADALTALLDPSGKRPLHDARVIEKARIYRAACLIGSGKPELADEPLRDAIRANPQMSPPDSLMFPPPVVDRYIQVRHSLLEELRALEAERIRLARKTAAEGEQKLLAERRRVVELERLALQETVVTKNSRWLALVPLGAGQFQNRQPNLGFLFLTSELALAGAAITSAVVISHLEREASEASAGSGVEDPELVNARLDDWYNVLVVSSYGFVAVTAAGIIQAQAAFVPEFRDIQRRQLPAHLRRSGASRLELAPIFAPSASGLEIGMSGRF